MFIISNFWTRLSKISRFVSGEQNNLWDTDKLRYFAITEFNNCFIIRSPSLFLRNIFGKRSDVPFSPKSDRKKEKCVVSLTHEQNYSICSQKQLNDIAQEHTIFCRQLFAGHVVGSRPMKRKKHLHRMIMFIIHSFKIFSRFWLAKSTRLIHHNQLLMTKFGRILCLTRKWRQKCSLLQVNEPLTEKTWGRGWVVLVVNLKNGGHFTHFKSKN